MKKIFEVFLSKTAKNTLITLAGNIFNALVILFLNIFISRVIGPSNFGLFSVALTFYLACFDIFGFGIEQGIVRFVSLHEGKGEQGQSSKYIRLAFKIRFLTCLLMILLAVVAPEPLAVKVFNNQKFTSLFTVVFLGQSVALLMSLVVSIFQAYQKFIAFSLLYGITGLLRLLLTIGLVVLNLVNLESLLAVFVFSPAVTFLVGFYFLPKQFISSRDTPDTFKNLFNFSKWIILWGITSTIHTKLDIFMIVRFLGDYATGIYSAASRLTLGIIWINSSIVQVLTPKYTRSQSNQELTHLIKKGFMGIGPIIIAMAIAIFLSPIIIPLIYGQAYIEAVTILKLLLIAMIFFMLSTPCMVSLTALGKSNAIGIISLFQVPLVFFGNLLLIPALGIRGAAITSIISNFFVFFVSAIYVYNRTYHH